MFNLTMVFGLPSVVGNAILMLLNVGNTATTIATTISAFMTGGSSILVAAGANGLKVLLKQKLIELGKAGFIAW